MRGTRRRLSRKYVVALVALVTGALLASGVVQLYTSYNESKAALVALQGEKARAAASRIETFVKEIERQLGWTTHPVASPAALDQRRQDSYRLQRQVQPITELSHLDSMGREQLRISRLAMEVVGSQTDYSQDPRFLEAKKGRTYFGPVYFRKDSEPYMSIAMPQSGGGVTVAEINLKFILDVISQIKIGKAGLAYTVDRNGVLIAHPDISVVLQKTSLANLEQVKAALTPGHEPVTIARDTKGREVLTAHSTIGPLGWVVFVEQPLEEAFEPLRASARSTGILVVAGIVLSVVVSAFLGRRMARPIQVLQESAAKIGAGDLSHRIDLRSGDELETLADEFNQMTGRLRESYVTLEQKVEDRTRELSESLEQQTATAEILRVISSSPTDVQPVFDSIAAKALDLCRATTGWVYRFDGELIHIAAAHSLRPEAVEVVRRSYPMPPSRDGATTRAVLSRTIVYVPDIREDHEYRLDALAQAAAYLSVLAVPMLLDGKPIGVLTVTGAEAGAFSPRQIALLQTFADQAVIAIENVRLFKELEEKNRTITEALEQQTATAEILRVISSSPTDLQPVFDAIARNALRLCQGRFSSVLRVENGMIHAAARTNFDEESLTGIGATYPLPVDSPELVAQAIREGVVIHMPDIENDPRTTSVTGRITRALGVKSHVIVPMLREGVSIGAIIVGRTTVGPFTPTQLALLQTFADQAVIAVQNVRLFRELEEKNRTVTEALEQQTATAEILRVISSSPTDVQPVFSSVLSSAVRLCGAQFGGVFRFEGGLVHFVTSHQWPPPQLEVVRQRFPMPPGNGSLAARAIRDRQVVQTADYMAEPGVQARWVGDNPERPRGTIAVPMLREGSPLGCIVLARGEPGLFSDEHLALLQTFADQAVIAIENVRLFKELEEKNRTITEALEQQTATAEILRVISSSPTDVQPVLDAVAENAARVCGAVDAIIMRVEPSGDLMRRVAHFGSVPLILPEVRPLNRQSTAGRAILDRQPVQIDDASSPEGSREFPDTARSQIRTNLAVPLLREGAAIGAIAMRRLEVDPFTEKQIVLLQTFADQAVIAIENVRLFKELEEKNRTITEALEQQTATSEILRVISSSPTDIQPVMAAVAEAAARLTDASQALVGQVVDPEHFVWLSSSDGPVTPRRYPISRAVPSGRAILDRETTQELDLSRLVGQLPYLEGVTRVEGVRTCLATPLLREGVAVGVLLVYRREVLAFTDEQVALLRTFADQAVIAIENVRLFTELQSRTAELTRSVGELEALGEVGRAISSTLDLEVVLSTIVARANQLAETDGGAIYEFDAATQAFRLWATDRFPDDFVAALRATTLVYGEGAVGRAAATRAPVQVADVSDTHAYESRIRDALVRFGYRSLLAVPLVSEDEVVGALVVNRRVAGEFPPRIVELLSTFATQSALAIQNARLFSEIEDKSRQLEVANQHKSEFLASVSHELRTPLNAIIGFSEVMLERLFGEVNEKQEEYLNDILSSGRHLLSLINDILDLAKIEAGRMELEAGDFDLPQAIDNTLVLIRERALRRGITVERAVDPRLGEINGDERKIKQVLLNLLSNAVKFTPEGGRIEVRAEAANGTAEISVADTGVGIAPEDHEAVFEEFRQVGTDYARKHEGTGLGLALARKFVELHGGRIWVKSQVGQGSTFTFTIPISRGHHGG